MLYEAASVLFAPVDLSLNDERAAQVMVERDIQGVDDLGGKPDLRLRGRVHIVD